MSFTLEVDPEVRSWAPRGEALSRLRAAYPFSEVTVQLWPRRKVDAVLGRRTAPYAFRAVSRGTMAHVFADESETLASVAWLIGHELGHHKVRHTPGLKEILSEAAPRELDPADDKYHEVDPEERYADGLVTALLGERLDRAWWRDRLKRAGMSSYGALAGAGGWMLEHRYGCCR